MSQAQIGYEIIKIQPRGVITIPKQLRDKDFDVDSFLRVKKVAGRLILEPVNIPRYLVRRYTNDEVDEFIELDKQESEKLGKNGLLK